MRATLLVVVFLGVLTAPVNTGRAAEPQLVHLGGDNWTITPFTPGFSLLEASAPVTYGSDYPGDGLADFPTHSVTGRVTLPVFLIDWSDFDPVTDESNHENPASTFPGYARKSREEISNYLNSASNGVAAYFRTTSGGQLDITFDVFDWMASDTATYLGNKEPTYYYYRADIKRWLIDPSAHARDILRSAVVDLGVDLTRYDADGNRVLDGFVIVYEGRAGKLAGTNLGWTNPFWYDDPMTPGLDNVATLVATNDPHYTAFTNQAILFRRYVNMPEQYASNGPSNPGDLSTVSTWAHEIGHLLLGYRDYYLSPGDLGYYALSARVGRKIPLHAAALEKWLFGQWFPATEAAEWGRYRLTNHHLRDGESYQTAHHYLLRIPVAGDPNHYLTIENRLFLSPTNGGSIFNEDDPTDPPPESGLVVFEVDRRVMSSSQILRMRAQIAPGQSAGRAGAFRPGDQLWFQNEGFLLQVDSFPTASQTAEFDIAFPMLARITSTSSNIALSFHAAAGTNYVVQYRDSVQESDWADLPGAPHNTGLAIDMLGTTATQRLYRIITR